MRLKPRRKFGLGVFLCLQFVMAVVAVTRVSGMKVGSNFDLAWIFLWTQIEACIAVSVVSFTAFRSVFISVGSRATNVKRTPGYSTSWKTIRRYQRANSQEADLPDLPSIPSVTLTGMRTCIRGGRRDTFDPTEDYDEHAEDMTLQRSGQRISHNRTIL